MSESSFYIGEISSPQYYIHRYYVNTYYHTYKFLENWISTNIFRKDRSRVFMASDSYCFRRRFELTDTSEDYSTIEFSSLRLPFANYWPQNSGWVPDPRIAAKSAALTYVGVYVGSTKIRAAQSILSIPVTMWFDREDDARMAYEILYFNSYNEHYYSVNVPYGVDTTKDNDGGHSYSDVLSLPMNLEISDLRFNPEFKETDWLKRQRVFVIKVDFSIRSYAILPPNQPRYDVTMGVDGSLSDGSDYESGFSYYYTVDDIILNFNQRENRVQTYSAGYDESEGTFKGDTPFPEQGKKGVLYVDSYLGNEEKEKDTSVPTNIYVWDSVNSRYVTPDYDTDIMSLRHHEYVYDADIDISRFDCSGNVTFDSNTIEWSYGDTDSADLVSSIELHMLDRGVISIDRDSTSYVLEGLNSNTSYYGYIIFFSRNGGSKRFTVSFSTPSIGRDEEASKGGMSSLVGMRI